MDEEEIEKVVLAYLKKKGLRQTELAFQEEQQAKNNADTDVAKQVVSFSEPGNVLEQYEDGYCKLRSWTYSSLDLYKIFRNSIRNIEQLVFDNVNKNLVGNKDDMDESKRVVPISKGQALADEYGISLRIAKTNMNVEEVFFSIAKDIKQRLAETDSKIELQTIKINQANQGAGTSAAAQKSS